jgi:hypothetical protein
MWKREGALLSKAIRAALARGDLPQPQIIAMARSVTASSERRRLLPRPWHKAWRYAAKALKAIGALHAAYLILIAQFALVFKFADPPLSSFMLQRSLVDGKPISAMEYLDLERIPNTLEAMTLRVEDPSFRKHFGVEPAAVKEAFRVNAEAGGYLYGASTLSMQLARTLFLSLDKTLVRKWLEALAAVTLDLILGKDRVLELYLNCVEWGPGIYGVGAAARYHYGKELSELSLDEQKRLVAVLSSPLRYSPRSFISESGADQLRRRYALLNKYFPQPVLMSAAGNAERGPQAALEDEAPSGAAPSMKPVQSQGSPAKPLASPPPSPKPGPRTGSQQGAMPTRPMGSSQSSGPSPRPSLAPLRPHRVQQDAAGDGNVQRVQPSQPGNRGDKVAPVANQAGKAPPLAAQDDRDPALEAQPGQGLP